MRKSKPTTSRSDGRDDDMWLAKIQYDQAYPLATTHIDGLAQEGGHVVTAASGTGVATAGTTQASSTDYEELFSFLSALVSLTFRILLSSFSLPYTFLSLHF